MRIVVTGGTGLLARFIVRELGECANNLMVVVSDDRVAFARELYAGDVSVRIFSKSEFFQKPVLEECLPGAFVIHTAFTRKNDGREIAKSLQYAYTLFEACRDCSAAGVINISSRSVYEEPQEGEWNTEESPVNANSLIASAKYGTELMLKAFMKGTDIQHTSLRVASINELKSDNNMVRPLNVFVDCVIKGENIKVFNGSQIMSFVDPRDVASAIRLICASSSTWQDLYNVGAGTAGTARLLDMAKTVLEIGVQLGYARVGIDVVPKNIQQTAGLDITKITADFGYKPRIPLEEMIRSLFAMKRNRDD